MTVIWKRLLSLPRPNPAAVVLVAVVCIFSMTAVATASPDWVRSARHRPAAEHRGSKPTTTTTTPSKPSAAGTAMTVYKQFVTARAGELVNETNTLDAAIRSNDLGTAKSSYIAARESFQQMWPVVATFESIDNAMDQPEFVVPDSQWTGFHPIEKKLFASNTTQGVAALADGLATNAKTLQSNIATGAIDPHAVADETNELLNNVSQFNVYGLQDRYAGIDVGDVKWSIDGAQQSFTALTPLLTSTPNVVQEINTRFAQINSVLANFVSSEHIDSYEALNSTNTATIAQSVDALAEPMSQITATVEATTS